MMRDVVHLSSRSHAYYSSFGSGRLYQRQWIEQNRSFNKAMAAFDYARHDTLPVDIWTKLGRQNEEV